MEAMILVLFDFFFRQFGNSQTSNCRVCSYSKFIITIIERFILMVTLNGL